MQFTHYLEMGITKVCVWAQVNKQVLVVLKTKKEYLCKYHHTNTGCHAFVSTVEPQFLEPRQELVLIDISKGGGGGGIVKL